MRSMRDSLRPVLALQHPPGPMARHQERYVRWRRLTLVEDSWWPRRTRLPSHAAGWLSLQRARHTCANTNSASLLSVLRCRSASQISRVPDQPGLLASRPRLASIGRPTHGVLTKALGYPEPHRGLLAGSSMRACRSTNGVASQDVSQLLLQRARGSRFLANLLPISGGTRGRVTGCQAPRAGNEADTAFWAAAGSNMAPLSTLGLAR